MPLSLDHIVIAVGDLAAATRDYQALGFTVVPGGEHAGGVTHNALVAFDDGSYLELIAFRQADPDSRWWRVLDGAGEGFVDYALLPGDVGAEVARANADGLDLAGPFDGGRARPDGAVLRWQTARSPRPDLPFLCGDLTARHLRVPEGEIRRHSNGVLGVAEVTVAVEDRTASARRYAALLGVAAKEGNAFALGDATVRLAARGSGADVDRALDARGEGPFAVRFRSAAPPSRLDPGSSHGARLVVGGA